MPGAATCGLVLRRSCEARASKDAPGRYGRLGNPAYPRGSERPAYPGSPGYRWPADSGNPAYPGSPGYGLPSDVGRPAYPGSPGYGYQSRPLYAPDPGSGYGSPSYGYPGDHASEEWSPESEYAIEPSS